MILRLADDTWIICGFEIDESSELGSSLSICAEIARLVTDGATDKLVAVATLAAILEATTAFTAFFSGCVVDPVVRAAAFATPETS